MGIYLIAYSFLRKNLIQIYIKEVAPWSTRQEMAPKLKKSIM